MIKLDRSKLNSESEKINILYDNEGLNNEERRWIEKQIIPPQAPLTIEKLNKNMCEVFSIKDRKREIKFFLKKVMNYSYKRGGSKVINWETKQSKIYQSIYSSRCLTKLLEEKYMINIDEASF